MEARILAGMTGGASWFNTNNERITVAIHKGINDALSIAGRLALVPECGARSGPEPRLSRRQRALQAFRVHVGKHQHIVGASVLHNGRYQTAFIKLQIVDGHVHLTTNPRVRRKSFTSEILYCPK